MKRIIALVLTGIMLSTSVSYAEPGGFFRKFFSETVRVARKETKKAIRDTLRSQQKVNEALREVELVEEQYKTIQLLEEKQYSMSDEKVKELKKRIDAKTGESGKDFNNKVKQVQSLKGRLKSRKNFSVDDYKDLQEWLKEIPDRPKIVNHPHSEINTIRRLEAKRQGTEEPYFENPINKVTIMPIPTTIPIPAPTLVPVF